MLRVISEITFEQKISDTYPTRNRILVYPFLHEVEASNSWTNLTDKAKIVLPKNVKVVDGKTGKRVQLSGTNVNIGGFSDSVPLFLKGDKVTIKAGYKYIDSRGNEVSPMNTIFSGYISNVTSKKPIELEAEDNMFLLKQITAPNKTYKAKDYTLEKILKELLQGTGFTVNVLTDTSFGDFRTQNETVAEVLSRIRKDYHFESYFRGNELRCGSLVYIEQDAIDDGVKTFKFQENIISDELDYKRKDDINLSAIAYSINKNELNITTQDGKKKTRCERLEVLVSVRNGNYVSAVKPAGQKADFAPNTAGERRTLYFWNVTDTSKLINLATNELKKYYYTGLRGRFTTFGLPYVRQGDNVDIIDPVLPERNGRYKVKSVTYNVGVSGFRQHIELDYLIKRL